MTAHSAPKPRFSPSPEQRPAPSPWLRPRASADAARPAAAPFFAGDWRAIFLGVIRAGDLGVIAAAGVASAWWLHGTPDPPPAYGWQILAGCLVGAQGLSAARPYDLASLARRGRHLLQVAAGWGLSVIAFAAAALVAGASAGGCGAALLLWALLGIAGLLAVRPLYWIWLARWSEDGKLVANVAIVGCGSAAADLARHAGASGERIVGVFGAAPSSAGGDDLAALLRLARRLRLDEIRLALPAAATAEIGGTLTALAALPTDVTLGIDLDGSGEVAALPALLLRQRPLAGWRIIVKRAMDLAIAAALLVFFAPLMLLIAALIRCDSRGPVIFRQRRFGFNQQPITIYKFRTMHHRGDDPTVPQAQRNDPRVTRLGRFLRRSSLDELPQLLNVLRGDMSLIGPRPHALVHDEKYAALVDGYLARHRVQAGITGWAQVNGFRGETDTLEKMVGRIEHDLFYIEHWSPLLDLRILLLTLRCAVLDRNAY